MVRFEQTTAAEIAASARLTERTFFRHFPDKREALVDGQEQLTQEFLAGVAASPADASPLDVVMPALVGAAGFFPDERGEPAATLAAQSGASVFGVAFGRWLAEGEERSLADIERDVVGELLARSTEGR